ncbi:MAG: hypothetical protein A2Z14_18015 [Chloroflexi bacterium RBG_16_48_8]|nr:MAG: hypothetical protein A2Z14_18015 [Chloroflexi bacterium RBG_16_48_8]
MDLNSWALKWINPMWNEGFTAGCGTNPLIFCPSQWHKRKEAVVYFLRMMYRRDYQPPEPKHYFSDVDYSDWSGKWIDAAQDAGIVEACGTSPLRFCPEETLKREVAAYMMYYAKNLGPPSFDFSLSLNPSSGSITQGSETSTTVTATLVSGTTQQVSLSCSGLPSGASHSFNPSSISPTASSVLTISTSSSTPEGTYSITVTGTGGVKTRTATYTLTITDGGLPSEIVANSGSPADIQAAIDMVNAGDTIRIPAGRFAFDGRIELSKEGITVTGTGTNETTLYRSAEGTNSGFFKISGNKITIKNIRFLGISDPDSNSADRGIYIGNEIDFRITGCYFEHFGHSGINVYGKDARGVIDHCKFVDIWKPAIRNLGYGVAVERDNYWEENVQLGGPDAVFIEDCEFIRFRHAVAANAGAHYVFRYNSVWNDKDDNYYRGSQAVDAHGQGYGSTVGTRAVEVYNNILETTVDGDSNAALIRGGDGVIFNNTIKGYNYAVTLTTEGDSKYQIHDLWIWNNEGAKSGEVSNAHPDQLEEERDYYLRQKPGYTPYTYPHPLTLNGLSPSFDFSISLSPSSASISQGSSVSTTVTAILVSETTQPVSLTCSDLPSGASYSFDQPSVNPTASSTLAILTSSSTPAGTYSITVTGTGGGKTRTATKEAVVYFLRMMYGRDYQPPEPKHYFSDVDYNDWSGKYRSMPPRMRGSSRRVGRVHCASARRTHSQDLSQSI